MDLPVGDVKLSRLRVEEVKELMQTVQKLWDEVDQRNPLMDLDPDYDLYKILENDNRWYFYAAEYKGLTSFYSFFIQPSLHVKGTKMLTPDFIYVQPEHRGQGVSDILILAAENTGKKEGANWASVTLKDFDKHNGLMERLGYALYENTFQKVI